MTVGTLKLAKGLVEEIGPDKTYAAYEYINTNNNEKMYAVFTLPELVDIYNSPFVKEPVLIFSDGKWVD